MSTVCRRARHRGNDGSPPTDCRSSRAGARTCRWTGLALLGAFRDHRVPRLQEQHSVRSQSCALFCDAAWSLMSTKRHPNGARTGLSVGGLDAAVVWPRRPRVSALWRAPAVDRADRPRACRRTPASGRSARISASCGSSLLDRYVVGSLVHLGRSAPRLLIDANDALVGLLTGHANYGANYSSSDFLQFRAAGIRRVVFSGQDPGLFVLDDVSYAPVPAPAMLLQVGAGVASLYELRRRGQARSADRTVEIRSPQVVARRMSA
jgi:hypothetical protein